MHRTLKWLFAVVAVATLGIATATATAAASAPAPANGTVHVWVTPGKAAVDQIVLTGAIGDYGTATSITKSGKVTQQGQYVKVALTHGTFEVDAVPFNQALNKLMPKVNSANCSAWGEGSGDITLYDGTGAYAGISGKIKMSTNFAAVLPRFTSGAKKGHCNLNGNPARQFQGALLGVGKVAF
jgi:hypothetical protein